jgi:SAM-dependent methyltransferase
VTGTGFTKAVRDSIRAGAQSSAGVIVGLLDELFMPLKVVDVGCGEGWFAAQFAGQGSHVLGIDHPDTDHLALTPDQFKAWDLEHPLPLLADTFDLCLSLEVAEHLTPERAPGFVADLCALAPLVVFSAAIPGQGGTGHLNEQWPDYWSRLFLDNGFACSGYLRWRLWENAGVENWYRQNLLVAAPVGQRMGVEFSTDAPPRSLVHPVLWEHYRAAG